MKFWLWDFEIKSRGAPSQAGDVNQVSISALVDSISQGVKDLTARVDQLQKDHNALERKIYREAAKGNVLLPPDQMELVPQHELPSSRAVPHKIYRTGEPA